MARFGQSSIALYAAAMASTHEAASLDAGSSFRRGVLPQQERPLAEGIAAEVAWAAAAARGAAREPAP